MGDPLIGAKLPKLLNESGFQHVQVMPSYSQVLSAADIARDQVRRLRPTEWGQRMIDRKLLTETELDEIEILAKQWVDNGEGVAGVAEVTAVAWKPQPI